MSRGHLLGPSVRPLSYGPIQHTCKWAGTHATKTGGKQIGLYASLSFVTRLALKLLKLSSTLLLICCPLLATWHQVFDPHFRVGNSLIGRRIWKFPIWRKFLLLLEALNLRVLKLVRIHGYMCLDKEIISSFQLISTSNLAFPSIMNVSNKSQ